MVESTPPQKTKEAGGRAEQRSRGVKENILTFYPNSKNKAIINHRHLGTVDLLGFGQS